MGLPNHRAALDAAMRFTVQFAHRFRRGSQRAVSLIAWSCFADISGWKMILLALAVAIVLPVSVPRGKKIPIGDGYARITKPSILRSLFPEAYATISYHPDRGQAGSIVLWEDIFDGPVMLVSGTNKNVLLCLYDYDTCHRLLRIHTDRAFKPLATDSDLKNILFACTWEIEDGTTSWDEVLDHLHKVSPRDFSRQTVTVGTRCCHSATDLLAVLARPGEKYAR